MPACAVASTVDEMPTLKSKPAGASAATKSSPPALLGARPPAATPSAPKEASTPDAIRALLVGPQPHGLTCSFGGHIMLLFIGWDLGDMLIVSFQHARIAFTVLVESSYRFRPRELFIDVQP